ncbi:MAG: SMC-Scp complex subunit ScpB [Microthrixaceae bacterium]
MAPKIVAEVLTDMAQQYEAEGVDLPWWKWRAAGGSRATSGLPYVERFVLTGQSARLSAAALETLAIVAYKQPISRAQIAAIRGVNVDGVIRTLTQRGYIGEVGQDPGPGQAMPSAPPRSSSNGSGSTPSTSCRPWGTSFPTRTWSNCSSTVCG